MSLVPVAVVESWLRTSGSDAEPLRWFCGARGEVVVEERAWRASIDSIEVGEHIAAAVFHVRDGRVIEYQRFGALAEALNATALTPDDELAV
jgi:hypothetical protein